MRGKYAAGLRRTGAAPEPRQKEKAAPSHRDGVIPRYHPDFRTRRADTLSSCNGDSRRSLLRAVRLRTLRVQPRRSRANFSAKAPPDAPSQRRPFSAIRRENRSDVRPEKAYFFPICAFVLYIWNYTMRPMGCQGGKHGGNPDETAFGCVSGRFSACFGGIRPRIRRARQTSSRAVSSHVSRRTTTRSSPPRTNTTGGRGTRL